MKRSKSPEEYIETFDGWRREALETLRDILTSTEMEEEIKWGSPHYTVDGKIVAGIAGFKKYVAVWFHQGALLEDQENVLVAASDSTKALRQWRFHSVDEINDKHVKKYAEEAVDNQKQGREIKPERKALVIPSELKEALKSNKEASKQFEKFTLTKKREYADYISGAKRDATKVRRLEKILPMIVEGVGLNDKYR